MLCGSILIFNIEIIYYGNTGHNIEKLNYTYVLLLFIINLSKFFHHFLFSFSLRLSSSLFFSLLLSSSLFSLR